MAVISEELCVGCGICVKKCPFDAIDIVSLPEELEHPTHRYGVNGFALYGLPIPVEGKVTGILGENGIGKSTAVKILSGQLKPNLGEFEREAGWEEILRRYTGTELSDYLQNISQNKLKVAIKPQVHRLHPQGLLRNIQTAPEGHRRAGGTAGLHRRPPPRPYPGSRHHHPLGRGAAARGYRGMPVQGGGLLFP